MFVLIKPPFIGDVPWPCLTTRGSLGFTFRWAWLLVKCTKHWHQGQVESISGMLLCEVDGWPFAHSSPTAGYSWTIGRWSIFEQWSLGHVCMHFSCSYMHDTRADRLYEVWWKSVAPHFSAACWLNHQKLKHTSIYNNIYIYIYIIFSDHKLLYILYSIQ